MLLQNFAADLRRVRRRRSYGSSVRSHHFAAERLLFVGDLDHVYFAVEMEKRASHGQRSPPLAGTGFRCHTLKALLLRVICLRNRGVQLMAAGSIVAFKLIVNVCRRVQRLLQKFGVNERRRTVHLVEIVDFVRNFKLSGCVVQFLFYQILAENARQLLCRHRLQSPGIEERSRLVFHIRAEIVPCLRNFVFFKIGFVRGVLDHDGAPFFVLPAVPALHPGRQKSSRPATFS